MRKESENGASRRVKDRVGLVSMETTGYAVVISNEMRARVQCQEAG